jgi:excisionase family DNA binding protein
MAIEFSTSEVAKLVGVSVDTIYRWVREGRLEDPERIKIGKLEVRVWTEQDLQRALSLRESNRKLRPRRPLRAT